MPYRRLRRINQSVFELLYTDDRRYTLEQFEEAFSRFGYIGSEDGSTEEEERFDSEMQSIVRENFKNLRDQLMAEGRELVMSCPKIEEEMLCGAMLDLAVRRMK